MDRALFMVGSALFALGSVPFYPEFVPCDTGELLNTEATNAFALLGALCFSAGARLPLWPQATAG